MKGGLLKYVCRKKKDEVVLSTGGITLATQTVNNGQVIFTNLEGAYIVQVGGSF
jgi:hypothetical protein